MPRPLIVLFTALSIFTNSVAFFTGGNDNGSAHNINGTTIVITLFVSDAEYGWNVKVPRDVQRIDTVNEYLSMAGDYLEEQVGSYGGEAVRIKKMRITINDADGNIWEYAFVGPFANLLLAIADHAAISFILRRSGYSLNSDLR